MNKGKWLNRYNNKQELELGFFKEIELPETPTFIPEDLDGIFTPYNINLYFISKIIDGKVIAEDKRHYITFENRFNLAEGSYILLDEDERILPFIIDIALFNDKLLIEEFRAKAHELNRIDLSEIKVPIVITKEWVKEQFALQQEQHDKEEAEKELERQQEQQQEAIEKAPEEELYNKESIATFDDDDIKITKNVIEFATNFHPKIILLTKNVNEILPWDFFSYNTYNAPEKIKNKLISDRQSYTIENSYSLVFTENGVKLNDISIHENKIKFLLNRLKPTTTTEEIKMLNKLSGMKFDILNTKEIEFNYFATQVKVDINLNIINQEAFEFECFNAKKVVTWDRIKHYFFQDGSSRSAYTRFDIEKLSKFIIIYRM